MLAVDLAPRPASDGPGRHLALDLREPDAARQATQGAEVVVHLGPHPDSWPTGYTPDQALDHATRGTYVLLSAAAAAGVRRVVLGSTLDLFEAYPPGWRVLESWRPRPGSEVHELAPYLAETSAREMARATRLEVICLRFGRLVDGAELADAGAERLDPRRLHLDDAVKAVECALAFRSAGPRGTGWWVFHIPGGRQARFPLADAASPEFGYAPRHDFGGHPAAAEPRAAAVDSRGALAPARPMPGRPIYRLTLFGASGPLAAAATPHLAAGYTLRLADILSPQAGAARIAARFPGAPQPRVPAPPHVFEHVDVTDGAQVMAAAEGAGALLNCTVVREDPIGAFRVNTLGAYHVMRAAVAHGIRRVVHTGPQILHFEHPAGYGPDFGVPDEAPPRPGANLYFHSKYLGLEICRVFAENHGLEVAALLFSTFVNPAQPQSWHGHLGPAAVSWNDAGVAMRRAVEVASLPSPCEVLRILGDLPHGKFTNHKARRVLGWTPRDSLVALWQNAPPAAPPLGP